MKDSSIQVEINNELKIKEQKGKTIKAILEKSLKKNSYLPYVAVLNGKLSSLNTKVERNSKINTFNTYNDSCRRAYENTTILIITYIFQKFFPNEELIVAHSICYGLFCEVKGKKNTREDFIKNINNCFTKVVEKDYQIVPQVVSKAEAVEYFNKIGRIDTAELLLYSSNEYVTLYSIEGIKYWFPSPPAPSTGLIKIFEIKAYSTGFVLRYPIESNPYTLPVFIRQDRLCEIFNETEKWGKIIEVTDISHLNKLIVDNKISEMIQICEALQEKKIAIIADAIASQAKERKLVFIAGPSSSGKTTFMKRLYIQLRALGYKIISLSIDDYFLDRDELRKRQSGNLNFEVLDAIDIELLNSHLHKLLSGESISPPKYDFRLGRKIISNNTLTPSKDAVFLIEGIHGLNPELTREINDSYKFKIYISALTHLNFDNSNRISTRDARLIRRIVRDNRYRGYSASEVIKVWEKVIKGEKEYIFPFQEEANIMFNSSLPYEIGVLKKHAEKALKEVKEGEGCYSKAERLTDMLSYFLPIKEREIPPTSILREFIGNSSFRY
jgi:uridine kinase